MTLIVVPIKTKKKKKKSLHVTVVLCYISRDYFAFLSADSTTMENFQVSQ